MIEVPSILKYDILDVNMKKYITLTSIKITEKASFHAEGPCKKKRLFAQHLLFRMVVSLLECYFLIKYLYSFENFIYKKRTHICDVYLKTGVFKYPSQLLILSPKSHF